MADLLGYLVPMMSNVLLDVYLVEISHTSSTITQTVIISHILISGANYDRQCDTKAQIDIAKSLNRA